MPSNDTTTMSDNINNNNNNGNHHHQSGEATTTTTITLEMNTDFAAAQRFPAWMCLTVFSVVCVVALQSRKGIFDVDGPGEAWVLSVGVISFLVSLIAVVLYLFFRVVFVGQIPEAVMIALLVAFWSAGLPTIMNPSNKIAVSNATTNIVGSVVTNANLYFFSWGAFCAAVYLSGSLLQETMGVSVSHIATKAARWYGLTAASLVVMGTSIRTFESHNCKDIGGDFCKRSKFAISIGVLGFCLAGGLTILVQQKKQLTIVCETIITTLQLLFWCFGVSYITFGKSPGSTIGNLYFSTWIAFILSVFLFAVSFRECVAGRQTTNDNEAQNEAPQPEFDDAI